MNFPTTRWSVLAQATLHGDAAGRAALGELCQAYWRPVADFLRQRGWSQTDAEDMTQEFFSSLLQSRGWQRADRARGKFRNFLLGALMRVLHKDRERSHAQKRGGGQMLASLDELADEGFEPGEMDASLAQLFDHAWAEQVMDAALETIVTVWEEEGRGPALQILLAFLPAGSPPMPYEQAAQHLGMSLGAVKSQILRLRQQFREALESQIARTVSTPHEIAEEMAHLYAVLAHPGYGS
jgi:RNA polymerase sigma-70 factor (ECF subfamily)